jgi:hypothetical protein
LRLSRPDDANDALSAVDDVPAALVARQAGDVTPACPVDRLPRQRRNEMCIVIIALGLANYLVYTLTYAALGGDAHNGYREVQVDAHGKRVSTYYVRGHFVHSLTGRERVVSRAAWIYSYVHSISVPFTSGAMIVSMLVLARPHILATMRGGWISGQTFVTAFGTIVVLAAVAVTVLFTWNFIEALNPR